MLFYGSALSPIILTLHYVTGTYVPVISYEADMFIVSLSAGTDSLSADRLIRFLPPDNPDPPERLPPRQLLGALLLRTCTGSNRVHGSASSGGIDRLRLSGHDPLALERL